MNDGAWGSLSGVRVLEVGQYIAGPYAASILASFGADVVKVEPITGDAVRVIRPNVADDIGAVFATLNLNKRYIAIDLRDPRSAVIMDHLITGCDVLIHNLRASDVERFGLDAQHVHDVNPAVVHCSVGAFYPDAGERPGYDVLVQAEAGMMALTGEADGGPCRIPMPVLDYTTGIWTALAAVSALAGRRERVAIRVSLQDVAMGLMSDLVVSHLGGSPPPRRRGSATTLMTPHGGYPTKDGAIMITAGTDHLFKRLADVLGGAVSDERFVSREDRLQWRDELDELLANVLRTRTSGEWFEVLSDAGIPAAVIREFDEAANRHVEASATGVRAVGHGFVMAPPIEVEGARWELGSEPGAIGRDTREILREAGFSDTEVAGYLDDGVIR